MKISTWHTPDPVELEVDVTMEDIQNHLKSLPPAESARQAALMVSSMSGPLKAISDNIINEISPAARDTIGKFLREQANRYDLHEP